MENQIDLWRNFDCSNVNTQKENLDSFIPARSNALCKPPPRHETSRRNRVYSRRLTSGLRNRTFVSGPLSGFVVFRE